MRKEILFVIGNVLTEVPNEYLRPILERHGDLLKHYMKGLSMVSHPALVMSVLDTVEHFAKLDQQM